MTPMPPMSDAGLLATLQAQGLVLREAHAPALPGRTLPRPWFVSVLLGVSGWLAGAFLLGFVALLFRPATPTAAGVAGAVLLGAAWALFKADRDGAFVAQLALALSIAGQCLALYALAGEHAKGATITAWALVLQAALALLMPNPLQRTLAVVFATIAWALMLHFSLWGDPEVRLRPSALAPALAPTLLAWAFTWLPLVIALLALVRTEPQWMARGWQPVLRPVLSGLIVGLAFATLASQPFESAFSATGIGSTRGWAALWPMLSAAAALAAAAAAFATRQRALFAAAIVAALLHVAHFYYALGTTLLVKSLLMLAMGAALLIAARWLERQALRGPGAGGAIS